MSGQNTFLATKAGATDIIILFTLLGRLKLFVAFVEQSLRTEYIHDSKTVDDWLYTLEWVEDSLFPLREFFRRNSAQEIPELRRKANRIENFKIMLIGVKELLVNPSIDPVRKLYSLLDVIVSLQGGLARWQRELSQVSPDHVNDPIVTMVSAPFPTLAPSSLRTMIRVMEEFGGYLINKDEINTCMSSRKVFILNYYTIAIRPQDWYARLHDQILRLHEAAKNELPPGKATESIEARRSILATCDAEQFMRGAAVVAG